jgi:hypothetical protein
MCHGNDKANRPLEAAALHETQMISDQRDTSILKIHRPVVNEDFSKEIWLLQAEKQVRIRKYVKIEDPRSIAILETWDVT